MPNKIEEKILEEKQFNSILLENTMEGVVACNADGILVLFNKTARKWHGIDAMFLPPEEWTKNYDLFEFDGKTPLEKDRIPLFRAYNGEYLKNVGMSISAKNQPIRYIEASGGPLLDEDNNKLGAVVILHDITERKEMEDDLKRMTLILSHAEKLVRLGSWCYIADTQRTIWSDEEFRIYGLTPGPQSPGYNELLAKYIHPDDRTELDRKFKESLNNKSSFRIQHRIIKPNGSICILDNIAEPYLDEQGNLLKYIGATFDITDRKKDEEELRKNLEVQNEQKKLLEYKSAALQEVLKSIDLDKNELINRVMANINNLIMPTLSILKSKKDISGYVELLEKNLESLVSSFGRRIIEKNLRLTPKEIIICDMIKSGMASKEIAETMNISLQTIGLHRKNIRKKLSLCNKQINLTSYLQRL